MHLLCSGLDNGDERQSAALTRALYYTSTRLASSRYAGESQTNEEPPKTENERELLMRRACVRTLSPCSSSLLERSLQPKPCPLCGMGSWLLLDAYSVFPGE
jgi:hypothetical protein